MPSDSWGSTAPMLNYIWIFALFSVEVFHAFLKSMGKSIQLHYVWVL